VRARVRQALTTWPRARDWLETLAVALAFGAVALPIGLQSGLLHPQPPSGTVLPLLLRTLIVPALAEELVFRVAPSPRFAGAALVAYVLYHPLTAWLFAPAARSTFGDPAFLLLAALLGGLCTLLYRRSGSLWPPVALHWLVVVGWLLVMGGASTLALARP
jgi:uncharacterized protein